MKKIIKKFISVLKKTPRIVAEQAFLATLVFIMLALLLGGLIFYKSCILVEKVEPEIEKPPAQFDVKLCQEVLREKENQQKRFEGADSKEYPDPFRGPVVLPEEPSE